MTFNTIYYMYLHIFTDAADGIDRNDINTETVSDQPASTEMVELQGMEKTAL